jgi:hypothetical protein
LEQRIAHALLRLAKQSGGARSSKASIFRFRYAIDTIRDDLHDGDPVRLNRLVQEIVDGLATFVVIFATAGAIGDHENTDPGEAARFFQSSFLAALIVHEQPPSPPHVHPA